MAIALLETHVEEATHLARLCKVALSKLATIHSFDPSSPYTAQDILKLPLDEPAFRIDDELYWLPRRKSGRESLAIAIASLLYPSPEGSLSPLIRYEADRVRLKAWAALQRQYDRINATRKHGRRVPGMDTGALPGVRAPIWASRILAQGPWDPARLPISTGGSKSLPMPVAIADAESLRPFFGHLKAGGTHLVPPDDPAARPLDEGRGEPVYGTPGVEFEKGVLYEDRRMDLCKMVVGPDHIGSLMQSLRTNEFVRHFLLGNNIIGPVGAREIASFVDEFPDRIDTWYLAGNCIDGPSFNILVDSLTRSEAVTNVWLKRNPLGHDAANDVSRLVIQAANLRTLDLDQTELGDAGVATVFRSLSGNVPANGDKLALEHIYLSGDGLSVDAADAIGLFMTKPHCGLTSVFMGSNPIGDAGAAALSVHLPQATTLTRLILTSAGLGTGGAIALCAALKSHSKLRVLELGQWFATEDLGQAYNYIEDEAVPYIVDLVRTCRSLEYLSLGHCAITPAGLRTISAAVSESDSLLVYDADSIHPDTTIPQPTFVPSRDTPLRLEPAPHRAQDEVAMSVRARLEANVRKRYGEQMTYLDFMAGEKRWLVSDQTDVRKIDSVYRNRDAGLARRQLKTLVKEWEEGDDTLQRVMSAAQGPSCPLRRKA